MENFWREYYSTFPKFLCPHCSKGRLGLKPDSLQWLEPGYSARDHRELEWSPEWITERFTCFLICDRGVCGEAVVVSGLRGHSYHTHWDEHLGEEVEFRTQHHYPMVIYPAPHIIAVSKKLNQVCTDHLTSSFALLWGDPAACANRIRTFIEHLLDQFEISRTGINKHGDVYTLNLMQRIEALEKSKSGHATTMKALKKVGDYASHQGNAKFDTLINCYELLEHALADLVDGRSERLAKLAEDILAGDKF